MNEQLKVLARQADEYAEPLRCSLGGQNYQQVRDERLAELVRQDEREACAMLCDAIDVEYKGEDVLATWCATAIRSRK